MAQPNDTSWRTRRTQASSARALALLRSDPVLVAPPPTEHFEAFVHLVRGRTREGSIELLDDPGPAVRAYAAECLLREHPADVDLVLPLLGDEAVILLGNAGGGGMSECSVGEYVLRMLRANRDRSPALARAYEAVCERARIRRRDTRG